MQEDEYIVIWCEQNEHECTDKWERVESMFEADEKVEELRKLDSTWTVSICAVVKSTDYDTHSKFKKL